MLSLRFVTGCEPDKWFHRFNERTRHGGVQAQGEDDPVPALLAGEIDAALVRLPDARVDAMRDELHVVQLYEEAPGIALPAEHTLTLLEEVEIDDVAEETVMAQYQGPHAVQEIRDGLQVVAANVGVVIAPRPMLRVLCGKKVEHRAFHGGDMPSTHIALVWKRERDADDIQDFVGVAKGRTANSSRQQKARKPKTQAAKATAAAQRAESGRRAQRGSAQKKRGGKQRPRKRR